MNRLLGNRGKPADEEDEVTNDYNECVAEIKKENPYMGHLALQHEAMKRVAERRAAKQDSGQSSKEDFAPQRIAFRRRSNNNIKDTKNNKERNSTNQSLSRSFIGFLSSSTDTQKTSNKKVGVKSHENVIAGRRTSNNFVIAGRRTTYYEEDGVHTAAFAMGDIELSDSEESSQRSSLSKKLKEQSSRRESLIRQSASQHRASINSSISTLRRCSSDLSIGSTTENSVESTTDDSSKPQHNPQLNSHDDKDCGEKKEKEEDIMDFVEEFLAKGGTVHPARTEKPLGKASSRRASLFSVEEDRACGESTCKSITSLGEGSSSLAARRDSLICGWTRGSLNESELMGADGDLICNWDASNSELSSETKKLPREINVGSNPS